MSYKQITTTLNKVADPEKAVLLQRFFKTGKGQYAEGDKFIGITVPVQRKIAALFKNLDHTSIDRLLNHPIHEYRLTALIILMYQFKHGDPAVQKKIYHYYLSQTKNINNWDLIDLSAKEIVGEYLFLHPKLKPILYRLVKSKKLWEKRIALIATFAFIRQNYFEDTLKLSEILLTDTHDLIHKAIGWVLREVGKHDQAVLRDFLDQHAHTMPRTALRYSIEHFSPQERRKYMVQKSRT